MAAYAQSPVPEPDTVQRVKQTDPPATAIKPDEANYRKDHLKITSAEIPKEIKRTLESSVEYKGWERARIYKNKAGDLYTLEISESDTLRTYSFNKDGKPADQQ